MCIKGDLISMGINERFRRCVLNGYYRIKGMGVFAFVPLLVLYIIIPVINYSVFQYFQDRNVLYYNIVTTCRYLVPVSSVWYVLFILYHFVEETGNEILYIFSKDKSIDLIFPYLLFVVLLLPLFLVYTKMFPELWFFYWELCMISLAYLAFAYFTAFLVNSISISVIGILFYTICNIMINSTRNTAYVYQEAAQDIRGYMLSAIIPYIVVAVVLIVAGKIMNRFLVKYKNTD